MADQLRQRARLASHPLNDGTSPSFQVEGLQRFALALKCIGFAGSGPPAAAAELGISASQDIADTVLRWRAMRNIFMLGLLVGLNLHASWVVWPSKVPQGQSLLLRGPAGDSEIRLTKAPADQNPTPWKCGAGDARCLLVAVPIDEKIGARKIVLHDGGREQVIKITVAKGKFKVDKLKIDPKIATPSPEDQKRAADERKEVEAAYALGGPNPLWSAAFVRPTSGPVTSIFGNQRMYNGKVQSTHFGTDVRANEKTTIRAVSHGKVVLAKNLFYAGNMVLLDHGAQLFSSYAHLSKIDVTVGQEVAPGDKLGMAGATGRVTGPHLHWSSKLNGVPTDPAHLEKLMARAYRSKALTRK